MIFSFFLGLIALSFFILFRKFRYQQSNNDTKSSIVSLPSPPTSLSQNWKHPVFPSFHGADVRKTFLSHILASFKRKGIYPFIDNDIDRSKSIGPELIEAIRSSKIAIVLLSKNYASSSWCLDELEEIIRCREVFGQIVMTIFYEVEPTDIKKQLGNFGKAFRKSCKGKTKEHIERWRKALQDVATIAGEHSCNWINEAAMIEKIATDVSNMLTISTPSRDFDDYVGIRAHIEKMKRLLCQDLDEVRMIGIWGPPGIGKTTIARVVFNQVLSRFQLGTIMVNIKGCYPRPCLDEYNAQLQLQNQMLAQIINQKDIMISHLRVAQEWLKDRKVLLVLDEVDRLGQLHALAKELQWFGRGSRIIITTEDRSLLIAHEINHIYKVEFPSSDEAFQIFCMHAFGQEHTDDDFYWLAMEVSNLAGKLPLGLKVLGSALRGKSKEEWKMILPRLKTGLDGEIESTIKFSYNALCDEDKYLFLYIACFFNLETTFKVEELLAKQFSNVRQGLHILVEKSLISINVFGEIEMHTLLKQFGIETSRKQFVHHGFAKRQLLVSAGDISEVLSDDTTDNNRFIAINVPRIEEDEIEDEWSDEEGNEEELNTSISDKALKRMSDLQFVRVHSCLLPQPVQSLIFYSPKLRSLIWDNFGFRCLPSSFNPEFLVQLHLQFSKLQKLWEGNKQLENLKWIDLSYSTHLKELPDLSTATKLEELILRSCKSLVELPNFSIAIKLTKLSLQDCSSLLKFPSSIGDMSILKELILSGCSCLVKLPSSIGTATNLQTLNLIRCSSLVKLPSSIGDLTDLEEFDLSECSSLVELPSSIGNLQKLWKLRMCGCSKLEALPTNINLESLVVLDLTNCLQLKSFPQISTNIEELILIGTAINEIPLSIKLWSRLWKLKVEDCNNLVSLPQFSDSLSYLVASNCTSLERLDCSFNNPKIYLMFPNCFKLNQEARDLIMHTSTRKYAILPGTKVPPCFNCRAIARGLLTIKLNEWPLPTYLRFKACIVLVKGKREDKPSNDEMSKYVQVNLMDKQNEKSDYVWINMAKKKDILNYLRIRTVTKQNDQMIQCRTSMHRIRECLTEHLYTFEVEVEEVISSELFFKFDVESTKWKIGECGLMQI